MDIYAHYGDKVRFCTLDAGYEFQQEAMVKHLKLGEVYTVHHTVVHDSSTEVFLKEAPGISFNSVFFEDMDAGSRIVSFWYKHGDWATKTFGAQRDHVGPMKHLAKEAVEAQVVPANPIEFADCLMLVLSGARNAGMSLDQLLDACEEKLEIVKTRHYPAGENGEPIEHDRSKDIVPTIYETLSTPYADIMDSTSIGMYHYDFDGCCNFGVSAEKVKEYRLAYEKEFPPEETAALKALREAAKNDPDYAVVGLPQCKKCNAPVSAGRAACDECIKNAVELVAHQRYQKSLEDTESLAEEASKLLDEGGVIRKIDGVFHYVVSPGSPAPDPRLVELISACEKTGYFQTVEPPYTRESPELATTLKHASDEVSTGEPGQRSSDPQAPQLCCICKGSGYIDAGVNFNPCLKCKGEGTVAVEVGE